MTCHNTSLQSQTLISLLQLSISVSFYSISSPDCCCRKVPHSSHIITCCPTPNRLPDKTPPIGRCNPISHYFQRPPYFSQSPVLSLVDVLSRHRASAVGVSWDFSGSCLIGWSWLLTSRLCQLIGERSRFEERSQAGARETVVGSPSSAERHGVGPANRILRLDRFYISFFRGLNVNTCAHEAPKVTR